MLKINKISDRKPVYDIKVKDNENFFANDILVHNCAEILEVVSPSESSVCNLLSLCLPMFVKGKKNKKFDFEKLYEVAYHGMVNLNKVIDINYYPVEEAKKSNLRHRPVGMGVQGLADVFFLMDLPFTCDESKKINKDIFETIYYAGLCASNDLAKKDGAYETFNGSPTSQGLLQFDLWGVEPSNRYDWDSLKDSIKQYGLRNSLTTCVMPTASTASIFGNEASVECQTSNIYIRRVLSGEFVNTNKHLIKKLCELGIWDLSIKNKIVRDNGSVQNITEIPQDVRDVYKTVWEIPQKEVLNMYADRGAFIDQTQSMNVFMGEASVAKLTSMHFYGWGGGVTKDLSENPNPKYGATPDKALKTGMYYLRTKSASNATQFTVEVVKEGKVVEYDEEAQISCSLDNPDSCEACGS